MIATILPSSTNFHAVEYNERKVAEGKAELVEMLNFGYISNMGEYSTEDLISFLNDYSAKNNRIQKPQFHIAFSCKGHQLRPSLHERNGLWSAGPAHAHLCPPRHRQ